MTRLLKVVILLIPMSIFLYLVLFNKDVIKRYKTAQGAYDNPMPSPYIDNPCPEDPCYITDVTDPCGAGVETCCSTQNGQDVCWYQDPNGKWWHGPDTTNNDDDGNGDNDDDDPIPTPTTTPTPGTATIQVYALTGPKTHLFSCDPSSNQSIIFIRKCLLNSSTVGCSAINGSISYVLNTWIYLNAIADALQTDNTGVTYTNVYTPEHYTISSLRADYVPYMTCTTNAAPAWLRNDTAYVIPSTTQTYLIGLGPILPWYRVRGGGNVYGDRIYSLMPLSQTPQLLFDATTLPTKPGIVSSSGGYNFDASGGSEGIANLSSTNWGTNNAFTKRNWYAFFLNRLSQAAQTPYEGTGNIPAAIGTSAYTVYKTSASLTINAGRAITNGEKIIFVVEGSLDIRAPITVNPGGFIAFIVRDDILINPTVGTTWDDTTPVVEGMYIAGGSIQTGHSTSGGTRKFVGKGMFIAEGPIITQRTLLDAGHNNDTPADLFIYNPEFLITMPDILNDVSYTWQEVTP